MKRYVSIVNLFAHYKLGLAYVEAERYAEGEATCEGALAIDDGETSR